MAYVAARPRHDYNDAMTYRRPAQNRWNPKQQEVIVIEDSPSPEHYAYHHETPANNTRGANKRRRLPELPVSSIGNTRPRELYHLPPVPHQPQSGSAYGSLVNSTSMGQQYAQYAPFPGYAPTTSSPSTTNVQYSFPIHGSDYRSSYGSPYHPPDLQRNTVVTTTTKRKRQEPENYVTTYQNSNIRGAAQAAVIMATTTTKHTRHYRKNKEVLLRKEPDCLPNFTGRSYDDTEGHYIIEQNSELTNRYQIDRLLGQGTFGKVVRAYDRHNRSWVAIKVIRAVQKYRDASMIELRVLRTLHENDPKNTNNCIHLQDCFDFRNHVCIVTELLNQSIFDFLKANEFAPFPNRHIMHFARQLFVSVAFLHSLDLIHTDLKPENILLVSNHSTLEPYQGRKNLRTRKVLTNSDLRLIDFGSATFQDEYHSNVVSTRHYRAPEIILGMGWSFPCDIWSIGCILIEFFTGDALFQTHDNLEHLAMMEVFCGRIDGRIIRSCSKPAQKMFRPSGRLDYPNRETSKDSRKFVKQMKSLGEMFPPTSEYNNLFCDLLQRIFVYDPSARITAAEALKHPFLSRQLR